MSAQQNTHEVAWLHDQIAGAESILEIGSSEGFMLLALARVCIKGARIRSIDLGTGFGNSHLAGVDTSISLRQTIARLKSDGYDAQGMIADSHSPEAIVWAQKSAPYDFVFIDADHSYDGVKADWLNYGPMGRLIGFHDISHKAEAGVAQLWAEIKAQGHRTSEMIVKAGEMGIGLVHREGAH